VEDAWTRHVAFVEHEKYVYNFCWNPERERSLGRMVIKLIIRKHFLSVLAGFI
jgi:hypothetical protein